MTEKRRQAYDRMKLNGTFSRAGRMGGMKTRERLKTNPDYYSETGSLGGKKMLDERGKAFYSEIGSLPKKRKGDDESTTV